jgi:glycosyltransferase involved in cell wall biosynthesis
VRILHAPTDVGGNAWHLSRAERAAGLHSDVVYYHSNYFKFGYDRDLRLRDRPRWLAEVERWRFALAAIRHYDVFHFNFGQSLLTYHRLGLYHIDMPLIKRLGKPIVITYQGCELRRFDYSTQTYELSACAECRRCQGVLDHRKAQAVQAAARYADHIYVLNPDMAPVAPKRAVFRSYTKFELSDYPRPTPKPWGNPIRIVHAPTDRVIKGTRYIQQACDALKAKGLPVELILVEGLSRQQALEQYRQADIMIDQVLIGWYGGFAVEGMALGKPVVCFLRYSDFDFLPAAMAHEIPIVNATPATLEDVLTQLVADPARGAEAGRRGWEFVQKWHNPAQVAQETKAVYERLSAH